MPQAGRGWQRAGIRERRMAAGPRASERHQAGRPRGRSATGAKLRTGYRRRPPDAGRGGEKARPATRCRWTGKRVRRRIALATAGQPCGHSFRNGRPLHQPSHAAPEQRKSALRVRAARWLGKETRERRPRQQRTGRCLPLARSGHVPSAALDIFRQNYSTTVTRQSLSGGNMRRSDGRRDCRVRAAATEACCRKALTICCGDPA